MGLAPWGALGGGAFKTEEQRKSQEGRKGPPVTDAQIAVTKVLESMSKRRKTALTSIALAYIMHKTPYVFPIVGGRSVDHLKSNIDALKLQLSPEELQEIEDAYPFTLGFPHTFLYGGDNRPKNPGQIGMLSMAGTFDYVDSPKPIVPSDN